MNVIPSALHAQVKEERNQVILDNEELQEQLDMSNTAQSAGNVKLNELKNEMIKVTEDLTRLECVCTTQEQKLIIDACRWRVS